jgi:hypothetical protein
VPAGASHCRVLAIAAPHLLGPIRPASVERFETFPRTVRRPPASPSKMASTKRAILIGCNYPGACCARVKRCPACALTGELSSPWPVLWLEIAAGLGKPPASLPCAEDNSAISINPKSYISFLQYLSDGTRASETNAPRREQPVFGSCADSLWLCHDTLALHAAACLLAVPVVAIFAYKVIK